MSINSDIPTRAEHLAFTSAAIATMGACPVWDAAMTKYLAAMTLCQAEVQYGATGKAEDADSLERLSIKEQHGKKWTALPDEITAPFQEAEDARSEAWTANFAQPQWDAATALVGTPAPTLAAAVFKDALIQREETPQWPNLPFDCMEVLAADFARLTSDQTGAAWAAVCQAEQAARDEAARFYDEHVKPANKAHDEGTASFADVKAQEEAVAPYYNAHLATIKAMMNTPAPTVSAVAHKLRVGLRDWFFEGSGEACTALEQIASDLARLTGEA